MAGRIKGITVEIGGDTTGLEKALRGVNSSIKTTQSQLKDVNKLLKLDPSNTELLTQKQKLLKDAISSTKEKLDTLKTAQEQAKAQLENGTLGQDKYDALQREIVETEQELKRLQEQAIESNAALAKIEEVGGKLQKVGGSISNVGQKLTTGVTLPLAAVGTIGVKSFAEVDKTMQLTNKTMGNTAEQAEALNSAMKDAAANSVYGMEDAATATLNFARAGLDAEQAADALAPAMNLAAGEGGNLDTVSAGLVATINGFHGAFSEAGKYADVFAAACNNSALDVDSLSEAMSVAAPIFASAGYSVNDAALYMGVMANNGIEADKAANSLKTGIARLVSPAKEGAEKMEQLGISVTNADGSMKDSVTIQKELHDAFAKLSESEQIAAASAIFGKNQMAPWLALINTAPGDVNELNDALLNCSGTTEEMSNAMMSGFGGSLEKLKSSIDVLVYSLGQALAPVIQKVVDFLQRLTDKFNALTPEQQQAIVKFGLIAAAIGPALLMLGKTISTVGSAMKGFSSLAKVVGKLGVKIAGSSGSITGLGSAIGAVVGPVLAVVAVIATLVAAFKHLWDTNEEFRAAITAIWDGIVSKFQAFTQGIVDRLNALGFDFENIVDVLKAIWDGFCNLLAPVFEGAFSAISSILGTVFDVITGILDVFIGLFTGNWSQLWDGVKGIFSGIWNGITGIFSAAINMIWGIADTILGWFGTSWNEVWTGIKTFFENIWNGIVSFFTGIWETIKNVVSFGIQFIGSILSAAWDIITLPFRFIWENCRDIITSVWDAIKNTVSTVINAVSGVISSVMGTIKNVISTVWTAISTKVSSVVNGIKNTVSTVFNAIKSVASTVWNGIKTAITTVVDGIKNKVSSVFNAVKSTVTSVFNGIKTTATNVWNGIKNAITKPIEAAKNTIKGIVDKITGFFSGMKLSLPHIKLPHFKITGKLSLAPPSIPHLSIDWYKEGGIMTKPTMFGMNGSSIMAGGEAGAEAILPLKNFYNQLSAMLDSRLNTSSMEKYLSIIADNSSKGIYLEDGTLVGHLLPVIDSQLGQLQKLNRRLSL